MNSCAVNRLVNVPGLAACVLFGTFTLYMHNNLLPYIYFLFCVGVIFAHTYLYCTRCVYYGKECYIFGGLISNRLFKGRREGPLDPDDAALASLWLLVAMFPVPFLLYYEDYILTAVFIALFWGWFFLHSRTACSSCDNLWCGLNKKSPSRRRG
jgi:hypothetical protein